MYTNFHDISIARLSNADFAAKYMCFFVLVVNNFLIYCSCWASLGREGTGEQPVSLGQQCYSKGIVAHELMHTLGFYHEQNRADQDQYIDIHYDNIRQGIQ